MTNRDHLLDLMVSRATEGLEDAEARELERLIAAQDELALDDVDEAATVADLGFHVQGARLEPLPDALRRRVLADAMTRMPASPDGTLPFPRGDAGRKQPAPRTSPFGAAYLGWYAAAAALALALWSPWSRVTDNPQAPAPTPAQQREALIAGTADVVLVAWSPPEAAGYAGVRGDVVWSNERQAGFMRLVGLPANVPTQAQYQLWIVDPSRDTHPIDGGVFDVAAGAGEVIVPIDAKLRVDRVAAFAITLEQPGGVVVSDGPLLVVASVG